ncbi:MAG: hypothetical protein PHX83_08065 [Acidobacteriia bacterium]|nr:hypothetical protein [Terriglobia bacterium]
MKKLTAMSLVLVLLIAATSTEYSLSAIETTPLTDSQLATLSGMGNTVCGLTAGFGSILVVAAGLATGGLGAIAAGALAIDATRKACTD